MLREYRRKKIAQQLLNQLTIKPEYMRNWKRSVQDSENVASVPKI